MDKFSVTLTKQKETKGTHVYANPDEDFSIYVPKAKVGSSVAIWTGDCSLAMAK